MRSARRLLLIVGLTFSPVLIGAGATTDRAVASLEIGSTPALSLSVVRQSLPEGRLRLRLEVQREGAKAPRSIIIYEGGGGDDGPGADEFRSVKLSAIDLPAETRGARLDFEYQIPGSRGHRQVDTWLISVDETPRVVLEATTRRELDRSRICHEVDEATLVSRDDGRLFVRPVSELTSDVSDEDDSPIDKACQGRHAGKDLAYLFDGETYQKIDARPEAIKTDTAKSDAVKPDAAKPDMKVDATTVDAATGKQASPPASQKKADEKGEGAQSSDSDD